MLRLFVFVPTAAVAATAGAISVDGAVVVAIVVVTVACMLALVAWFARLLLIGTLALLLYLLTHSSFCLLVSIYLSCNLLYNSLILILMFLVKIDFLCCVLLLL